MACVESVLKRKRALSIMHVANTPNLWCSRVELSKVMVIDGALTCQAYCAYTKQDTCLPLGEIQVTVALLLYS